MSESQPSPPGEADEASRLPWWTDDTGIRVKNRVVLPQVDLETGEHEPPMICRRRVLSHDYKPPSRIFAWTGAALCVATLIVSSVVFKMEPITALLPATVVGILARAIFISNRQPHDGHLIWEFISAAHLDRDRQWYRRRFFIHVGLGCVWTISIMGCVDHHWGIEWPVAAFLLGVLFRKWVLTRTLHTSAPRITRGHSGCMRLDPIHPQAMAFLQEIEQKARNLPQARKRWVRTVYYHRYPLRFLIGAWKRDLMAAWRTIIMKTGRSKFLEQDFLDRSEEVSISIDGLSNRLRESVDAWLAAHPDWKWVHATSSGSVAGDLTIQRATVASPDLAHIAMLTHFTSLLDTAPRAPHLQFNTYLADGVLARTRDHGFLNLPLSNTLESTVTGSPEHVFAAHLQLCGDSVLDPPQDIGELEERINMTLHKLDELLEQQGFVSPAREEA